MKVSLNWLKDYIDLDNIDIDTLDKEISQHVCEIESIKRLAEGTNLVTGKVLSSIDHPNSDHLHICEVNLGNETKTIVCGAPNVAEGQIVIVALPGAKLPGGEIKVSKVRGVESNGMICSLVELGIEDRLIDEKYRAGIYVLPEDTKIGEDVTKLLGLDDMVIDLALTNNRSDLLSMEGVAYDISAALDKDITLPLYQVKETKEINPIKVKIETDLCYEYQARLIRDVKVKESPMWLKMRLIASGIRPINNVVDITNYVMIALGNPMHAYDENYVGNNIVIKEAKDIKKFTTLDEIERDLEPQDILITDGTNPIGLGGIMGGLNSEVTENTTSVVLEVAMFDPMAIRKTSSRLNLKSEASTRFERLACQTRIERAINMASALICELAGGTVVGNIVKDVKKSYTEKSVDITLDRINSFLGTNLSNKEVEDIFSRLAYEYKKVGKKYQIIIPSRRMDLEDFWADICEDVARMIGYDKIPTTNATISQGGQLTEKQAKIRGIRETLAGFGLNEVVSYSLVSEEELNLYNVEDLSPIKILMPLTSDKSHMRISVLNGLISSLSYNLARQIEDVQIFEIAKRYTKAKEETMLGGAFKGRFSNSLWQKESLCCDFFFVKGVLDLLASKLNVSFKYEAYKDIKDTYHPGVSAKIYLDDTYIGFIAQLHPKFAKENDLKDVLVFEINLDKILDNNSDITYKIVSKYPSIERDLAIIIDKNITAKEVLDVVNMVAKKYLVNIDVFDLYEDKSLGENKKSLGIKMLFNDSNKTLETKDVDKLISSILNRLDYYFKASLR